MGCLEVTYNNVKTTVNSDGTYTIERCGTLVVNNPVTVNGSLAVEGSLESVATVTSVSSTYIILATDAVIRASGSAPYQVTLPSSSSSNIGKIYTIKSVMNPGIILTLATTTSQYIDDQTTISLSRFEAVQVISNGTGWNIVGDKYDARYT